MIRTQIQLTEKQARELKRLAKQEGKSIAELIRAGVDAILQARTVPDTTEIRRRAIAAAGKFEGSSDMAKNHDQYLADIYRQ